MNISKFRAIPKIEDNQVPFKLNENALLNWLHSLVHKEGQQACLSILHAIQALNATKLSSKKRIAFLNTLEDYLKRYLNSLSGCGWDAGFPLSHDDRIYAEAFTWNYLALAHGFFIAAQDYSYKADKAYAAYLSLDAISQAQLRMAAVYSLPLGGFWKLIYSLFEWAEKKKVLNVEVEEFNDKTVHYLFNKILIFNACDTNQFRPRDMLTIFNFLDQVSADLPIFHKPDEEQGLFVFELLTDNPPINLRTSEIKHHKGIRYFSPVVVAHSIYRILRKGGNWNGALKSINEALFKRVIKSLGLGQKRRFTRLQEDSIVEGVIGLNSIVNFLRQEMQESVALEIQKEQDKNEEKHLEEEYLRQESFKRQQRLLGEGGTRLDELKADDLAVLNEIQMGSLIESNFEETDYEFTAENSIWEKTTDQQKSAVSEAVLLTEIKIFDSSAKGYSVYWDDDHSKAKIGDIFGVLSADEQRLEIAVIRRIMMNDEDSFRFGSEVVGFESEAVYICHPERKKDGVWAVFVPGIKELKQADSLIFEMGSFKTGHGIFLCRYGHDTSALITRELHSTSGISHVEIDYPPA